MPNPSIRAASAVIEQLVPSYVFLGDDGNAAHGCRGYHIPADTVCEDGDCYSVCLPRDLGGDPDLSSAWDLGFGQDVPVAALMRATRFVFDAMKRGDPVVSIVREAYGTLDGQTTVGWDAPSNGPATTSEDHSTHLHLSIYRDSNTNTDALMALAQAIAAAVNGEDEDDMTPEQAQQFEVLCDRVEALAKFVANIPIVPGQKTRTDTITKAIPGTILGKIAELSAKVDALNVAAGGGTVDVDAVAKATAAEFARLLADAP